jgi:hypothetical protein
VIEVIRADVCLHHASLGGCSNRSIGNGALQVEREWRASDSCEPKQALVK